MKKCFNKIVVLSITLLLFNCNSYNSVPYDGYININDVRSYVINDFINSINYKTPKYYLDKRKGKTFDVFWITDTNLKEENIYAFAVFPENNGYLSLSIEDSLGKVPKSNFPNNYIQKGEILFIWHDSITPLNQNVINVLNNYHILDSVNVKIALGLLPFDYEDDRFVLMDSELKSIHYYICQNNVKKCKKVITNKALGYYKRPNINCSMNKKK
ncbi:MAG: hypothetical protein LBI72_02175 [Flavobacteriaceae bacterium]|jgi:hypothetical protein|nr:hypothetical protein [Flavobacteriaceae bacterium]